MKKLMMLLIAILLSSAVQARDVQLAWDNPDDPQVVGYHLYRCEIAPITQQCSAWVQVNTVLIPVGTETYADIGLDDTKRWGWLVRSVAGNGLESEPSNAQLFIPNTRPVAPPNVRLEQQP